jgi:hypothetical protein
VNRVFPTAYPRNDYTNNFDDSTTMNTLMMAKAVIANEEEKVEEAESS